jgi:hypothetical protein
MSGLISVIRLSTDLLSTILKESYPSISFGYSSIDFIQEAGGAFLIMSLLNLSTVL